MVEMAGPPVKASICADKILEELEKAEAQGLRVCAVRDKDVSGPLDLSTRTVKVALDIQNCDFQREVDLSYWSSPEFSVISSKPDPSPTAP